MGPLGVSAAMLATSAAGSLLNKKKGPSLTVIETPEQRAARGKLLEMGTGDLSYKGTMGSFDMTPVERVGQNKLLEVVSGLRPEAFGLGSDALKGLMGGDAFDPYNDKGSYAGFKDSVLREGQEASDRFKRSANMAGNLYSTNTIKRLGDVEGDTQRALTGKLGELYDAYTQRRLDGIPLAFQAGQAIEALDMGRVGAAMNYGGLPRALEDESFKRNYAEFIRAQDASRSALGAVAGQPQVAMSGESGEGPWGRVLDAVAYGGGAGLAKWMTAPGAGANAMPADESGIPFYLRR
jgi:hypothetical protein